MSRTTSRPARNAQENQRGSRLDECRSDQKEVENGNRGMFVTDFMTRTGIPCNSGYISRRLPTMAIGDCCDHAGALTRVCGDLPPDRREMERRGAMTKVSRYRETRSCRYTQAEPPTSIDALGAIQHFFELQGLDKGKWSRRWLGRTAQGRSEIVGDCRYQATWRPERRVRRPRGGAKNVQLLCDSRIELCSRRVFLVPANCHWHRHVLIDLRVHSVAAAKSAWRARVGQGHRRRSRSSRIGDRKSPSVEASTIPPANGCRSCWADDSKPTTTVNMTYRSARATKAMARPAWRTCRAPAVQGNPETRRLVRVHQARMAAKGSTAEQDQLHAQFSATMRN